MSRAKRRKKKKRGAVSLLRVLFMLLVLLLIGSAAVFFTDLFGVASSVRELLTASKYEIVDESGIRQINGDFSIDQPGEKLEKTHISGNLFLGPGIGDGSVELVEVTVDGAVLVQGGGLSTIYLIDCILAEVKVNRPGGDVRLVASGQTSVASTVIETGSHLLENLSPGAEGFGLIEIMTAETVKLAGSFETIKISVPDSNVEIASAALDRLIVTRPAAGTAVSFQDGLQIDSLYLDGSAFLLGKGEFKQVYLSAPGTTELAGSFEQVRVTAEAGQYRFREGSTISELIVEKEALNNILSLDKDVSLAKLELNEAAEVTGEGLIELLMVNAAGSKLEQIPLDIVFNSDVVVLIAGYEITTVAMLKALLEHGDPLYTAAAAAGQVAAPKPAPKPAPAPAPAPAPVPEPPPAPDPVREFIVAEGLIPGKKLVIVALTASDPQNYQVSVSGTVLGYNAEAKRFWGEVDVAQAERKNVKVTR